MITLSSHEDSLSGSRKMATADKSAVDLELGVGGGGSENNRGPAVSAATGEIVGMRENGRGSSASQCSVEVDLEGGVQETKIHLAKSERDCRICHLTMDAANQESGIPIELGCSCKEDLAAAHKQCAEAWFKIKGNNVIVVRCLICWNWPRNWGKRMMDPSPYEIAIYYGALKSKLISLSTSSLLTKEVALASLSSSALVSSPSVPIVNLLSL